MAQSIEISFLKVIIYLAALVLSVYCLVYFYKAHRNVYHSHGFVSFIIGTVLFAINIIAFLFLSIILGIISFLMIH